MYVIHTMLISTDGDKATYAAQVVSARWINKGARRWSGRTMRDTGDRITMEGKVHSAECRERCDAMSREVATRLGMTAGPDAFPFA